MGILSTGKEWDCIMKPVVKHDISLVQKTIIDKYGFEPSEAYCADLIAFVEQTTSTWEEDTNV